MPHRFSLPALSVRARLGLIQLLLLAALLVIGLVSLQAIHAEREAAHRLALLSRIERLHLDADMMHDALHAEIHAALRVAAGNPSRAGEVLAKVRENAHQYLADLEQLQQLPLSQDLAEAFAAARPKARAYIEGAIQLAEAAVSAPEEAQPLESAFTTAFDELLLTNDALTRRLDAQVELAEQHVIDREAIARRWIIITSVLTMMVAWVCVALIARSIRLSLGRVSNAARALAAGNLSVRSEIASQDEVGELAGSLNKMADELQHMINRLLSDADRDAFTAQLMQALEMAESERDAQDVVSRAMAQISPEMPMEMLLAGHEQSGLNAVAEHPARGRPGCGVDSLGGCVAIRRSTAMVFSDSEALNACPRLRERATGAASAVCVPVTFMGRSLGVLHAAAPVRKPPTPKQVAQITALGMQAGARIGAVRAYARAQLHAYTDALTGLPNRRAMEANIDRLQDAETPYAWVIADLDHFKRLNDTHGHEAGDGALRLFAEVLRTRVRKSDKVARWGGEEFAILCPESTAEQAAEVLERVRAGLAETLLASGSPAFTASFGVSDSAMAGSFEQVTRLADSALYVSKEQGRDRMSLARRDVPAPVVRGGGGETRIAWRRNSGG